MALEPKQERFCREYVKDLNAERAALKAGYSKKTARHKAAGMLAQVGIKNYIDKIQKKVNDKLDITTERIRKELYLIATCDIAEAFDENGNLKPIHDIPEGIRRAIASIEVNEEIRKEDNEIIGFTKKIKFWSKPDCLEMLGKHLGFFLEDNKQKSETLVAFLNGINGNGKKS